MKKRNLGNTDIKLTSIGFGGALEIYLKNLNETHCFDIVKKSFEMNISIFLIHHLYMDMV